MTLGKTPKPINLGVKCQIIRALLVGVRTTALGFGFEFISLVLYADDAPPTLLRYILDYLTVYILWPVFFLSSQNPSAVQMALLLAATVLFWGCLFEVLLSAMKAVKRYISRHNAPI